MIPLFSFLLCLFDPFISRLHFSQGKWHLTQTPRMYLPMACIQALKGHDTVPAEQSSSDTVTLSYSTAEWDRVSLFGLLLFTKCPSSDFQLRRVFEIHQQYIYFEQNQNSELSISSNLAYQIIAIFGRLVSHLCKKPNLLTF